VESSSRTLVCSVLFLDIVEYSKKPVAEQLELKQAFNQILAVAVEHVAPRDRIILDTGDGAAVTFMGDPEDALFAAMTLRNSIGALPVRMGVNLGPVRLVKDLNGQMNIIGDGINVAQRVMSFADPGQLLVSRSYYEVVSCLSRDYLDLFHHEGSRTDKHVREHEVYSVIGGRPATRHFADTESRLRAKNGTWVGFRKSALIAAPLAFVALAGTGIVARAVMDRPAEAPSTVAAPPSAKQALVAPPKKVATAEPAPAPQRETKTVQEKRTARVEKRRERAEQSREPLAAAGIVPGRVEFSVAPWAEIVVDGRPRGFAPPLRGLELAPGPHVIEVRNSTFPSRVVKVDVKAGQVVTVRHIFQ
jgi:class 3 adenylate cyclase